MTPLWPPEAVTFLSELEEHNDREWFRERRELHKRVVAEPTQALGEALADFGRPHTFRPYRDTRFHPGPPIKEQVGLAVGYEGAGGWYVELSMDGVLVAAGLHNPQRDQLARMREAFADERRARRLDAALQPAFDAGLTLNEPDMKRGPRGYDADHPRMDLLKRRALMVSERHPLEPWIHDEGAVERVRAQLEAARGVVEWVRANVGATTLQRGPRR